MTAVDDARRAYERAMASDTATATESTDAFNALVAAQRAEAERQRNALSREGIKAMSLDEFQSREPEIDRWMKAGAKDGEPAPPAPERTAGHTFTLPEVKAMTVDEFAANEAAIREQLPQLGEQKAAEHRAAREKAGR